MQCNSFDPITFSTAPTCYVCSRHGRCKKEAAAGATNTDNGKAERGFYTSISAYTVPETPGGCKHEN